MSRATVARAVRARAAEERRIGARGRVFAAAARALHPPDRLTVSEWAARHRVLTTTSSAAPGLWRNERTPYLVEVMDALSPQHPAERVVVMAGAQLGKSETGNNWIGYVIAEAPGPMLMVRPTEDDVKRYSKQRIKPLLESTPALAERVRAPRDREGGNSIAEKEFAGGLLLMVGANSPVGLASTPVRYLFCDEVDRWPAEVASEGDPLALAIRRTSAFTNRKILITATPTVRGRSRVEAEYLNTDQRRWEVPCPHCEHMQELRFRPVDGRGGLRWEGDPHGAWYVCASCDRRIEHSAKAGMVAAGRWRATAPGDDRAVGFAVSSLVSPWLTWGEIAAEFVRAKGDPVALKAFVNTLLAETWDEDGGADQVTAEGLETRCEDGFGAGSTWEVPAAACVLTMGVDVQDDRVELEVVAWGEGQESWSIDWRTVWGDPTITPSRGVWEELDAAIARTYTHPILGHMKIAAVAVDTGAHTLNVYKYVKPRQARRVWGVKGASGQRQARPIWPMTPTRNNRGGIALHVMNVDQAKDTIYLRLKRTDPGPGYCHFPRGRSPDYFAQLTAEVQRTKRNRSGYAVRTWALRVAGSRNEALDLRVYAYGALLGYLRSSGKPLRPPEGNRLDTPPTVAPRAPVPHVPVDVPKSRPQAGASVARSPDVIRRPGASRDFWGPRGR